MTEREQMLRQLGAEVDYPSTPPLAQRVARQLEEENAAARRAGLTWRPLSARAALLATALFLLLAGSVLAAVPTARHALLDLVGLRGVTVVRVDRLADDVEARPGIGLGKPTTIESALRSLDFRPLLPTGLGEPNGVFVAVDLPPPGGELSLTYAPRPGLPRSRLTGVGLLINEIHGGFGPGFFGKLVPRGVEIKRLRVDGRGAVWIPGLHQFFYKDANHTYRIGRTRLAGNTLLVQHGEVMVRIEGRLGLAQAVSIDRSLR